MVFRQSTTDRLEYFMIYKNFVLKASLFVLFTLQAGILFANDRSNYKTVDTAYVVASPNFVRVSSNGNEISRNDFKKIVDSFTGANGCNFQAKMRGINESLIIRLIGYNFIKDGVPKTSTSNQSRFYELALQTNSIPSSEDKSILLKVLFDDSCLKPDFGYDSKLIRDFWAQDVRFRAALKTEIIRDQVTYKEISERLSSSQAMSDLLQKEFKAVIDKNPDLAENFFKSMMPIMSFVEELQKKYGVKF